MGSLSDVPFRPSSYCFGEGAALVVPPVELLQLDAQHGGVQVIQAAVVSHAVNGALHRAVIAQLANALGDVSAIGDHGAAVTEAAQILLNDEAGAHGVGKLAQGEVRPRAPPAPARCPQSRISLCFLAISATARISAGWP